LPEVLLPILLLSVPLGVTLLEAATIAGAFLLLDIAFTRFRHPRH
jgi:hypothetical protein